MDMDLLGRLIIWIVVSFVVQKYHCASYLRSSRQVSDQDLRNIDGYVSSGLPLFSSSNGFLLHSSGMRPVIVKVNDPNKVGRDGIEQQNAAYYSNLPSVIPEGYEGVASTSFLLGRPIPPLTHYPSSSSYSTQNGYSQQASSVSPLTYSSQSIQQQQPLNYNTQQQQHLSYNSQPIQQQQQSFTYSSQQQQPLTYNPQQQQPLTYNSQQQQPSTYNSQPIQQQQQPLTYNSQPIQTFNNNNSPQQPQSYQSQSQSFRPSSFQPQQQQQQQQQQQPKQPTQFADSSIRVENSLKPGFDGFDRSLIPTNFIGGTGYRNQDDLVANKIVQETFGFEDTLPENLRNPFYSNSLVASMLAQESLPAQGEQVVGTWNTDKIREGKIRDLLVGAGFVS